MAGDDSETLLEVVEAQFTAMLVLDECTPVLRVSLGAQEQHGFNVSIQSSVAGSDAVHHAVVRVKLNSGSSSKHGLSHFRNRLGLADVGLICRRNKIQGLLEELRSKGGYGGRK